MRLRFRVRGNFGGSFAPHGFTLVELLVVLAVVVLLLGILLPTLGAARDSAYALQCSANLRQNGLALHLYTNDYAGTFPQPFAESDLSATDQGQALWFNAVDYYFSLLDKRYNNAANRNYASYKQDPIYLTFHENTGVTGGHGSRTFKMNANFGDDRPGKVFWARQHFIRQPTNTVLIFDGAARDVGFSVDSPYNYYFHGGETYVALRHGNQTANVLFVDGHVAASKQESQRRTVGTVRYDCWYPQGDARQTLIWQFHP